ncbi:MAG: SDR family NAD(P)-dependent oxidoreductase [Pseudomonadota bacterium]
MPDWLKEGNVAVITGGASGIGLAAAQAYAARGMRIAVVDRDTDALSEAQAILDLPEDKLLALTCDVSDKAAVAVMCDQVHDYFGTVHCLMNNAGAGFPTGVPWENFAELEKTLAINLMGVIHGCHAFIPRMLEHGESAAVINTGSKQGITKPPGNYAYNLSKAGVVAYTESIAHAFATIENSSLSAHLLIPGFVYTGMVRKFLPEQPPAAWTPQQMVEFMLDSLERGDFYILCPDNDVDRATDEKRIRWNADDIIENRPALSRWHPDWADRFEVFMKD